MDWLRALLYWWRTVPCPYMCGGRLPSEGNQSNYYEGFRLTAKQDACPNCGRALAWHDGHNSHWRRAEPLGPPPKSVA